MSNTQQLFMSKWLPTKPLVSNNLAQNGLKRVAKNKSLEYTYIETQPSAMKNMMIFDIDKEQAAWDIKSKAYDDNVIPEPNFIITNPASEHAHIGYILEGFVSPSNVKATRYYNNLYKGLQTLTGGDRAYGGRITRNPFKHQTEWLTNHEYKLAEINDFVKLSEIKVNKKTGEVLEQGRNDTLFNSLRTYSYTRFRQLNWNSEALKADLLNKAYELNASTFDQPLPKREVELIVRSITKWVSNNLTKEQFSSIQRARSLKRWGTHVQDNDAFILMLKDEMGFTIQEVADNTGLSFGAAKTAYYRAKKRSTK